MKTPLNERPIFHQVDRRMGTHMFLCLQAWWLLITIEKTLMDKEIHTSWSSVKDTLKMHPVSTIVLPLTRGGKPYKSARVRPPSRDTGTYARPSTSRSS